MEVAWHCYVLCPAWQPVSIKQTNWNEYRWQVSILRPSAHKAITISLSDLHKSNDATDDVWKLFHWATPVLMLKFYVACAMTFWRASCHFTASVQLLIFWSTPLRIYCHGTLLVFCSGTHMILSPLHLEYETRRLTIEPWVHIHYELLETHGAKWV